MRPPRVIHLRGEATTTAMALGKRLVPHGSAAVVVLPGAFVWHGRDHTLVRGTFMPTYTAWGRGSEPMTPLAENDAFAALPGLDESDEFAAIIAA